MTTTYTGDTLPDLVIELTADDGLDATAANSIRIIGTRAGVIVFDRAPSAVTHVNGVSTLTMTRQTDDTIEPGPVHVEVEITWPTGVQTVKAGTWRVERDADYTT